MGKGQSVSRWRFGGLMNKGGEELLTLANRGAGRAEIQGHKHVSRGPKLPSAIKRRTGPIVADSVEGCQSAGIYPWHPASQTPCQPRCSVRSGGNRRAHRPNSSFRAQPRNLRPRSRSIGGQTCQLWCRSSTLLQTIAISRSPSSAYGIL